MPAEDDHLPLNRREGRGQRWGRFRICPGGIALIHIMGEGGTHRYLNMGFGHVCDALTGVEMDIPAEKLPPSLVLGVRVVTFDDKLAQTRVTPNSRGTFPKLHFEPTKETRLPYFPHNFELTRSLYSCSQPSPALFETQDASAQSRNVTYISIRFYIAFSRTVFFCKRSLCQTFSHTVEFWQHPLLHSCPEHFRIWQRSTLLGIVAYCRFIAAFARGTAAMALWAACGRIMIKIKTT